MTDNNVYAKYHNIDLKSRVIFAASGGYTNADVHPEGLTIDQGKIINATLMHDRDGIVIIDQTGNLNVINLAEDQIQLPHNGPKINNPLNDLMAFSLLLNWAQNTKTTIFQTHLLAAQNDILIEPSKRITEKKMLAIASNPINHQKTHVIFDISRPSELYAITNEIVAILRIGNSDVEAIINLDVGAFNIMQLNDVQGNPILSAPIDIKAAPNLIIYTLDN